jgi:Ca2+-binding RTX toxin-like protein
MNSSFARGIDMAIFNALINGQADFSIFGNTVSWNGGNWIGWANFWAGDRPAPAHSVNVKLAGDDWHIEVLRFSGERPVTLNIEDDARNETSISYMLLGTTKASIALNETQVENISGERDHGAVSVSIAKHGFESIHLGDADNTITLRGDGGDTVRTGDGDDRLRVFDTSVRYADLEQGNNIVRITGEGQIQTLRANNGQNTITLEDDARVFLMKVDGSVNTISTADGNVESFYSYLSSNTMTIGTGGFQQMIMSGNDDLTQTITSRGFIGSLEIGTVGTARVTLLGNAGADTIRLGGGNDRVSTADGYVTLISTSDGNDRVSLGEGGAGFVRLGQGNDRISVSAFDPESGLHIQGGGGADSVDLSAMGGAIEVDLSKAGTWQDVANGRGFVGLTDIENVVGGRRADGLTGNDLDNVLTGGKGNDLLEGGGGSDTFVILADSGRDRVVDFDPAVDVIDFAGATRLSALTFADVGDNVLVTFGQSSIVVEDITIGELRTADAFGF